MLDKSVVKRVILQVCSELNPNSISPLNSQGDYYTVTPKELEHFAQAIYAMGVKDERERCVEKLKSSDRYRGDYFAELISK